MGSALATRSVVDAIYSPLPPAAALGPWAQRVAAAIAALFAPARVELTTRDAGGSETVAAGHTASTALATSHITFATAALELDLAIVTDTTLLRRAKARAWLDLVEVALENALLAAAHPASIRAEFELSAASASSDDASTLWRDIIDGRATLLARGPHESRTIVVLDVPEPSRRRRRLSQRTADVLLAVARGEPLKSIAARIDRCHATVSRVLSEETTRMGVPISDALRVAVHLAGAKRPPIRLAHLTEAERDVLRLLREGLRNEEIAQLRHRSSRTVANQVAALLHKTSALSRRALALYDLG